MIHRRTLPVRRWLALSLVSLFIVPILSMVLIGFFIFQIQGNGRPSSASETVAATIRAHPDQWDDPAWQQSLLTDPEIDSVDVVLMRAGKVIFRSSEHPIGANATRRVEQITIAGTDPVQTALVYSSILEGPPQELRQWFVPVIQVGVVLTTLFGIALFLRRSIVDPLTAASEAARRIAAGEMDIELPSSRVREISELNNAFEAMSASLQSSLSRQADMEQERRLFISAIAHDLRTPLFSLRGSLEGLEKGIADTPEKQARYVAIAQAKADALERLIADLFAFTRMEYLEESPDRESIDLDGLLRKLADGARPRADNAGIHLIQSESRENMTIQGDVHLLTRAVENLLDNAFRYTPEGGTVRLSWARSGTDVRVIVADSGPGLADTDLPHLFEALYRGESSRNRKTGGAGLGLTVARRIVEAHGGTLTAANGPTGGAVFTITFTLPRERQPM
ncbi:MAG TPA: HAMP domain-containing sensor histidine kinase [Thermomicrobiales bacterium]|nr:HAMP domain-containing sensor histidine kinase [Thermomicrobiales bacterium]